MSCLYQPTLVLNKSWTAIHVTFVKRALIMLYAGVVRVVDVETFELHDFESWANKYEDCEDVRTPHGGIKTPEVVVLVKFNRVPKIDVSFTKRNVYRRDNFICQYCGDNLGSNNLSIDHVVPISKGGESSWENCVLACLRCNNIKGDLTLEESGMRLKNSPKAPHWFQVLLASKFRKESWEKFIKNNG